MKYKKYLSLALYAVGLLFSSCAEDELNSKELLAYMKFETTNISINNKIDLSSSEILTDKDVAINIEIGLSRETSVDVMFNAQIDKKLVDSYNERHKTNYLSMNEDMVSLNPMEHAILAGNLKDTLKVNLNRDKFLKSATYLLPIRLNTVSSADKGVKVSSNMNVTYVVITATIECDNVDKTTTLLTGNRIERKLWTTMEEGNTSTYKLYDNNLTTYWSGVTSVLIDMGKSHVVKGFDIINYTAKSIYLKYAPKMVSVYLSEDGKIWMKHGESNEFEKPTEVSSTVEKVCQVKLKKAYEARYFRIDVISQWNNRTYLSEIFALE